MKILILDNYDSFTYNLVYLVRNITGENPVVKRNDAITLEEIHKFDKIILSPGPGIPTEAGIMMDLLQEFASTKSILGICLGHQAIGIHYGADITNMLEVVHGQATEIQQVSNDPIFSGLENNFEAGRYHSWIVSEKNFPDSLEITAVDDKGLIMALRHKRDDVKGLQFHPESIMTRAGETMVRNWINDQL